MRTSTMFMAMLVCAAGVSAQPTSQPEPATVVHKAVPIANPQPAIPAAPAFGGGGDSMPPFAIMWDTIDGGGGPVAAGPYLLNGTAGQHDPAVMNAGSYQMTGGYWFGGTVPAPCYADCDQNAVLDINDFICFQTYFAIGDPLADCDQDGQWLIDDFICFQTYYALGC
jgi:hypothetical protein